MREQAKRAAGERAESVFRIAWGYWIAALLFLADRIWPWFPLDTQHYPVVGADLMLVAGAALLLGLGSALVDGLRDWRESRGRSLLPLGFMLVVAVIGLLPPWPVLKHYAWFHMNQARFEAMRAETAKFRGFFTHGLSRDRSRTAVAVPVAGPSGTPPPVETETPPDMEVHMIPLGIKFLALRESHLYLETSEPRLSCSYIYNRRTQPLQLVGANLRPIKGNWFLDCAD